MLLLDAELDVLSCSAVRVLPRRLDEKAVGRVAYAHRSCVEKMYNRTRACALMAARTLDEYRQLETITHGFTL